MVTGKNEGQSGSHHITVFVNRQLIHNYLESILYLAEKGIMSNADFEGVERLSLVTSDHEHVRPARTCQAWSIEGIIIGEDKVVPYYYLPEATLYGILNSSLLARHARSCCVDPPTR